MSWEPLPQLPAAIKAHYQALPAAIDSFIEKQLLNAQYFHWGEDSYCAVYQDALVHFQLDAALLKHAAGCFEQALKLGHVKQARVFTADTPFLSWALDYHQALQVQGHNFELHELPTLKAQHQPSFRLAGTADKALILNQSADFFDEKDLPGHLSRREIYIAQLGGKPVGFGVLEPGQILSDRASIGCYTHAAYREQGLGKQMLHFLIQEAQALNLKPVAGCWAQNKASQAMLVGAGFISRQRYLNVQF